MVAIVTGNGLGLQSSSALGLGGRGQVGSAGFGKSGEQVFVNAATGNLILRDRDQWLLGRGVDAELYRAYNSQAQLVGEAWRSGTSKQVNGLTGTVNTAGSTVTRTDWDGSRTTYAWDTARSLYVATSGAGTRDALAWDGGNQRWTWTQGGSQLIERYDATKNGRLFESVDRDGNAVQYSYNAAGSLSQVATANGETTILDYDGSNRLSKVRTVTQNGAGPQTSTAVRYSYDGSGRLSTVTLDLSPDDNSVSDGKVFTSTYAYDGSSARIASITQSDGAKVAFTYQLVGSDYRVASIAQTSDTGVLRTTTLSYDVANRRTTITDPLGQDTILSYDDQGRLLQTSSPAVAGVRQTQVFTYNADGQVAIIRDGLNNEVKYTYDAAGNLIKQEDAIGTIVERTFGSDNQLLSETVSGPNTVTATTRYVYDAEQHLRFKISAEGRVTEYRYNAEGQMTATIGYADERYLAADRGESALASWAAAQAAFGERVDYGYDFRGNLFLETRYLDRGADGIGINNGGLISIRYVYDAQGRLLQRYKGEGAGSDVEQFTYDGLGRTLTSTGFNDAITVTQYDDAQRRVVTTFASGLVRTSSYNHAGELVALSESSNGVVLSQVSYRYDADGRLRMTEDAIGSRTHVLYDEAGRRAGEISADGALTEYQYDFNNQVIKTTRYAKISSAQATLVSAGGNPKQKITINGQTVMLTLANSGVRPAADSTADRSQWRFYDATGRLSKTVDADGALVDYVYDAASRLVSTLASYKRVDMAVFAADPSAANAVSLGSASDAAKNRETRYLYDSDGLLRGRLDAEGYLTETFYDGAGRKIREVAYARPAIAGSDLDQIRPGRDLGDRTRHYIYDARGLLAAEVDGEGYVTRYQYDQAGNVSSRQRGSKIAPVAFPLTASMPYPGSFTARAEAGTDGSWPQIEVWVDGVKVQAFTLSASSSVHNFTAQVASGANHRIALVYPGASSGRQVWIEQASFAGVAFDAAGAVWDAGGVADSGGTAPRPASGTQQLNEAGALRWAVSATTLLTAVSYLPGVIETTEYQYDLDGRLLKQTEYSSAGNTVSQYRYDSQGRRVEQDRAGQRSLYRYDAQGRMTGQLSGEGAKALAALEGNATAAQVEAVWQDWGMRFTYDAAGRLASRVDALDRTTLFYYDSVGRLTHTINPMGEVTEQRYNMFGEVIESIVYAKRLTSLSLGQMYGGQMSDSAYEAIAALDDAQASRTSLGYAITGLLNRRVDALGGYTQYEYSSFREAESLSQWTDRANRVAANEAKTLWGYDRIGRQNRQVDDSINNGRITTTAFNAFGEASAVDVYGIRQFQGWYDHNGRLVYQFDANNLWASREYDAFGNVLSQTDRSGNKVEYSFAAFNREVRTTTAEGVVTVAKYDAYGHVIELADGRGNKTIYEYDQGGQVVRVTTPTGITRSVYDQAGQAIETYDANGVRTTYQYDAAGRMLVRLQDPDGLKIRTAYEYDAKGQLVRATDPLGVVTETHYDLSGQKITIVVDAGEGRLNLTTTFDYDALGRALRVTEGAGTASARITLNTYDKQGQLLSSTIDPDGLALKTQFAYLRGNLSSKIDANGNVVRYVYDENNRLTHTVDATGAVTVRSYDADGRLVELRSFALRIDPNSLGSSPTAEDINEKFQLDPSGQRVRYAYDQDGRLRYAVDSLGYVAESIYDKSGNIVKKVAYQAAVEVGGSLSVAVVAAALAAQGAASHYDDRISRAVYDAVGRAIFTIDSYGNVVRNRYDANGNLLSQAKFQGMYMQAAPADQAALEAWASSFDTSAISEQRWVYDAAGRAIWNVDAGGQVTRTYYDAAGQRRKQVRYGQLAAGTARPSTYSLDGMAAWQAQYGQGDARATQPTTLWFYDAAGRVAFSYDAEGYFSQTQYDGIGNVVSSTRYERQWGASGGDREILLSDSGVDLSALLVGSGKQTTQYLYDKAGRVSDRIDAAGGRVHYQRDALGQVVAEFAAWGTSQQTIIERRYDGAGRLIEETRGARSLASATGRYVYDAFGRMVASIDPRGVELAESDSQWAKEQRKALGYVSNNVALPASSLSAAQKAELLARYTSRSTYDLNGRLLKSIDPLGATVSRTYNAFDDVASVTDAMGRVGYFYYDMRGLITDHVDPEGYLTRTERDSFGNPTNVTRFGLRVDPQRDLTRPPLLPAGSIEATTEMRYDLLGRLVKTIDAESGEESFTYDAFGNRVTYLNKLGGLTRYDYDKLGRVRQETLPIKTVNRTTGIETEVINRYEYDAHGNRVRSIESADGKEARDVRFGYDALNRKISSSSIVASGSGDVTVNEAFVYDAHGNLVQSTDANNRRTLYYYNESSRLSAQVDPTGLLTEYVYDAVGNLIRSSAYVQPVAIPAGPADPKPAGSGEARITAYGYDAVNRRVSSAMKNIRVWGKDEKGDDAILEPRDVAESWIYDLGGRLLRHTDANGGITRSYYDALGRKRLSVDAEGYGISYVYDAEGHVVREMRYAQRYSGNFPEAPDGAASGFNLDALLAGWPQDGKDRITEYTYDLMGRRLTESRLNVAYGVVNGSGQLTQAVGNAITSYGYDAAGNLLRRTDANGNVFGWEYDLSGRNTAAILPSMVDYAGRAVSARTEYRYNGLNQVVSETRRGVVAGENQADSYDYGSGGRLLSKTNALNYTVRFGYDAVGNMTSMSYVRTDSAGVQRTETLQTSFDSGNREIHRVTVGSDGSRSVERRTAYNLFGDVVGRGTGVGSILQEFAEYDLAGRMIRSNMEGGAVKLHAYDGNGNAVVKMESQTIDLKDVAYQTVPGLSGVFTTITLYDKRNQVVDVIQPTMTSDPDRWNFSPTPASPTRTGQISVGVGGPVGGPPTVPQLNAATHGGLSINGDGGAMAPISNSAGFEKSGAHGSVPDTVTFTLNLPDYTAQFGPQYQIRVVVSGEESYWVGGSPQIPGEGGSAGGALDGQFVGTQADRRATIRMPSSYHEGGFLPSDGEINGRANFSVTVFVISRSMGGGREYQIAQGTGKADARGSAYSAEFYFKQPVETFVVLNPVAPSVFSIGTIRMPNDAFAEDNTPRLYYRTWNSNGTFQELSISRSAAQGVATADISGLPAGDYEVLYVSVKNDGTLMRRERYWMRAGAGAAINIEANQFSPAYFVNGVGTFIWSGNSLHVLDLRAVNGVKAVWSAVEYRRKGTQDAWAIDYIPYLIPTNSFVWTPAGLSGDYEVRVHASYPGGGGHSVGEMTIGAAPRTQVGYEHDSNVLRFGNLPLGATTASFSLKRPNGSIALTVNDLPINNGLLVWDIPQWLLDEAGTSFTEYTLDATLSSAGRTIPAVTYGASGKVQIGPMRQLNHTIAVAADLYTLSLSPPPPATGEYAVLHYRPEGDLNQSFQNLIVRRAADGKFHWDAVGLDKSKIFEYYYDVYATLDQAQNPGGAVSQGRYNGYFLPVANGSSAEVRWVYKDLQERSDKIIRSQSWNAFGEIATETVSVDNTGNPNVKSLEYNTLGKLTRVRDPSVKVMYANGYDKERAQPEQVYYYDLAGSVVGYRDANNNLTTQAWNYGTAKPSLIAEWHPDGGVKRFEYDVLGNQRVAIDELGYRTDYSYDAGNRLSRIDRPARTDGQRGWDTYAYDEQDRRIRHTNILGTDTADYSIEGEVSQTVSAEGRITRYTATWDALGDGGNGVWERVTIISTEAANDKRSTDIVNAYGQKLRHQDFGDHRFVYRYNKAGLLASTNIEGAADNQATVYEYYNNGLIKTLNDQRSGIVARYEYDRNGNRTFEGLTGSSGAWVFQQSTAQYDELNRLIRVQDPRYVIDYSYDAQGNRIRMKSSYVDPITLTLDESKGQTYWYRYDSMNRFTVTMGALRGGEAANKDDTSVSVWEGPLGGDGVTIGYNAAGQRGLATYASDGHTETYRYDAMGYLTDTIVNNIARASRVNDLAGRVIDYYERDSSGAVRSHITHTWDRDSLLKQDHDNLNNKGTKTYRLADGTVSYTETYGEATVVKSQYSYQWFDSAKQTKIDIQASNPDSPNWQPGFTRFVYDEMGRIKTAVDDKGHRAFVYQVDGEGRILQRDEWIGGYVDGAGVPHDSAQNRNHSYFLFDDRQVGNVGNDGIDRIDYVKELAQNQAPTGARNDDRHKRFTPVSGVDFDQNYQPINSLYPTAAPGSYIVKAGDTLQSIATALWGDGAMWYLLADANGLAPNQPLIANTVLTVPNKVTNIHNNASTFKPYDAGAAMGNTSPTVPEPPPPPAAKKGCGGFVQILALVVAIVVTIYTAGAASGLLGWGGAAAGAAGGAVGAIASQAVLIAGGEQEGFDWKGVALGAIGGAVGGALSSVNFGVTSSWGQAAIRSAVGNIATQGAAKVLGVQDEFDWKSVAISAVSAGVGSFAGDNIADYGAKRGWSGNTITNVSRFGQDAATGVVSAAARGNLSSQVLLSVGLDALASTLGSSIADKQASDTQQRLDAALARTSREVGMQNDLNLQADLALDQSNREAELDLQLSGQLAIREGLIGAQIDGDMALDRSFDRSVARTEARMRAEASMARQAALHQASAAPTHGWLNAYGAAAPQAAGPFRMLGVKDRARVAMPPGFSRQANLPTIRQGLNKLPMPVGVGIGMVVGVGREVGNMVVGLGELGMTLAGTTAYLSTGGYVGADQFDAWAGMVGGVKDLAWNTLGHKAYMETGGWVGEDQHKAWLRYPEMADTALSAWTAETVGLYDQQDYIGYGMNAGGAATLIGTAVDGAFALKGFGVSTKLGSTSEFAAVADTVPNRMAELQAKYGHLSAPERRALLDAKVEANAERWVDNLQDRVNHQFAKQGRSEEMMAHFTDKHAPDIPLNELSLRSTDARHPRTWEPLPRNQPSSQFGDWRTMMNALNEATTRQSRGLGLYTNTARAEVAGYSNNLVGWGFRPRTGNALHSYNSWLVRFDEPTGLPFTAYPGP
ncbi:LysM peptidoglycan-binding domain-containing protein [Lysobacter gummosus]|uniref:LysM peptidoglycan-binding domain-containing protein n=1 Tax=Lysobacter gummosus TaxID=262324 RepID=A0ABY3XC64_9GAMM|nr:LysM peptidoglycan-binding domain-containing protein [Lysobacter gummosus]ALN92397.1 lysM domain protein [Lysobacter gummosus]UNP27981.1 LysM peptidoglycan-binding domain-containing protein [Lysobacter gummosus]